MATGRLEYRNETFQVSAHEIKKIDLERLRQNAEANGFLDDSTGRPTPKIVESAEEIQMVKPFQIALPAEADPAILPKLKQLLVSARSETGALVEILIPINSKKIKRVRVPFSVAIGEDLEKEIKDLTGGIQVKNGQ
jgi:hypothetical protein